MPLEVDCEELYSIAEEHGLVLMDAIKTAYSTAYERLVLLAKSGKIGKVVSVDAVCTSLRDGISIAGTDLTQKWNSMCGWAPAALLPVFQILGTEYRKKVITTKFLDEAANMDAFTKIDFTYDDAVASIKVAKLFFFECLTFTSLQPSFHTFYSCPSLSCSFFL